MWSFPSGVAAVGKLPSLRLLQTATPATRSVAVHTGIPAVSCTYRQFCYSLAAAERHHDKTIFHLDDNATRLKTCHFAPAIDQLCMIDLGMTNTFCLPHLYRITINVPKNSGICAFQGGTCPAGQLTRL